MGATKSRPSKPFSDSPWVDLGTEDKVAKGKKTSKNVSKKQKTKQKNKKCKKLAARKLINIK